MRMEDQRNRSAGAGAGMKAAFKAPFRAGKNHFGHEMQKLA